MQPELWTVTFKLLNSRQFWTPEQHSSPNNQENECIVLMWSTDRAAYIVLTHQHNFLSVMKTVWMGKGTIWYMFIQNICTTEHRSSLRVILSSEYKTVYIHMNWIFLQQIFQYRAPFSLYCACPTLPLSAGVLEILCGIFILHFY